MKRLISLLCALCLLFSLSVAEAYEATNPYTIENIGMTIDLPEALNVTSCEVGETSIDLRLGYNGRNDVSYAVMITYDESLEDYVTITLPEENLQAMIDYYQSMYTGGNPGLVAYDENDGDAVLTPFCAGGQGEDGNMYCISSACCTDTPSRLSAAHRRIASMMTPTAQHSTCTGQP